MKKFFRIEIIIGFLLLFLAFLYRDTLSLKNILHLNFNEILFDPTLDEMQDTYLKLFSEYKKLKLKPQYNNNVHSKSNFVLIRDPFELPKSKIKKINNSLISKTSDKNINFNKKPLKLIGTLWDETSPSAIINDKIVNVGSYIGSYKVIKILPNRAILTSNKNILVLEIPLEKSDIE
ncbi:MAG: hypothetical protein ACE5JB_10910 [bacterium]